MIDVTDLDDNPGLVVLLLDEAHPPAVLPPLLAGPPTLLLDPTPSNNKQVLRWEYESVTSQPFRKL